MKPVQVTGIFDHTKEIMVDKYYKGEKGVEIITPFYTHLNEKGEECGIMVNRGWVPEDLKLMKMHYNSAMSGTITGLLYRGDPKTKYTYPNAPLINDIRRNDPYELSLVANLNNKEEAGKFMLLLVD